MLYLPLFSKLEIPNREVLVCVSWLVHCILVLLSVAFFTLFERKVMGLFHLRIGPNKTAFIGLVQPLLDAFKLLSKQDVYPVRSNKIFYFISPIFSLFFSLFVWLTLPYMFSVVNLVFSIVVFFLVGSLIVFAVLLAGWASNSKYSLLGSLRSVAQSVSYESVFSTLIVLVTILGFSFSVHRLASHCGLAVLVILPLWIVCTLAETHRAPFDFSEAESELVSGFNTEYSGAFFAFIFLSEYSILLYSCFLIMLVFGGFVLSGVGVLTIIGALVISFVFIWIRITFCRFRYDLLMGIAWKLLLPVALAVFRVILVIL